MKILFFIFFINFFSATFALAQDEFKFNLETLKDFLPENKFDSKNPKILNLSNLAKEDKKEIKKIINADEKKLENQYDILKEMSMKKLRKILSEESDNDVRKTIKETIEKVESDPYSKINFVKLKSLSENL